MTNLLKFKFKCAHDNGFTLYDGEDTVECDRCKQRLSSLWVLHLFAKREGRLRSLLTQLRQEVDATKEKLRCKCQHCGQMTKITRRL